MENAVRINVTPSQGNLCNSYLLSCSASVPLSQLSVLPKIECADESSGGLVKTDSDSVGLGGT